MNNLENPHLVSPEIREAIKFIVDNSDAVFGGSIALNAVGLINRPVHDIDLFFSKTRSLANFLSKTAKIIGVTSDTVTDVNGEKIQRTGAKIGNVNICIFKVDDKELEHSEMRFFGSFIKIQNVNYAIQAKIAYSNKNPKHFNDLTQIAETLTEVF